MKVEELSSACAHEMHLLKDGLSLWTVSFVVVVFFFFDWPWVRMKQHNNRNQLEFIHVCIVDNNKNYESNVDDNGWTHSRTINTNYFLDPFTNEKITFRMNQIIDCWQHYNVSCHCYDLKWIKFQWRWPFLEKQNTSSLSIFWNSELNKFYKLIGNLYKIFGWCSWSMKEKKVVFNICYKGHYVHVLHHHHHYCCMLACSSFDWLNVILQPKTGNFDRWQSLSYPFISLKLDLVSLLVFNFDT